MEAPPAEGGFGANFSRFFRPPERYPSGAPPKIRDLGGAKPLGKNVQRPLGSGYEVGKTIDPVGEFIPDAKEPHPRNIHRDATMTPPEPWMSVSRDVI